MIFAPLSEESRHKGEKVPVGFIGANFNEHRMEVHAYWLPWATPRNILESWLKFLSFMKRRNVVLVFTTDEWKDFFDQKICPYGVLRKVGILDNYYGTDEAWLYQTRGYHVE